MKDNDWFCVGVGFLFGVLFMAIVSALVCHIKLTPNSELIKRGIKQYNQQTGTLEWVQKEAKE